ncbi:ubiquitin-protein ligase E3C [Phlebotomus argentipes]|uniref:ubiquitin-protein ligase E3C n=1 Tax=Phlebotomus argentipes TaxID=94469 RepID=UPI002892A5A7|nr:ubiquitin-protein ligase E3C [Phlebotomus argentipes]
MYNFNGDFRRRPEQNFSGQSRKPDRDSVIRRAQVERLKREEARQQETSAFIIQSFFRSYSHRQRVKASERCNFDAFVPAHNVRVTTQQLDYLLQRFIFFFDHSRTDDCQRLLRVCELIIQDPNVVFHSVLCDKIWKYRLQRLLLIALRQLHASVKSPPGVLLQIYEIFIANDAPAPWHQIVIDLLQYLLQRNFFLYLRTIIDSQSGLIPTNPADISPNLPCFRYLQLTMKPLYLLQCTDDDVFSVTVLSNFLRHILSPELTRSSKILLLPYFVTCKKFPYMKFLTYLSSLSSPDGSHLFSSSLLYSLLYLDRHYLDLVRSVDTKSHYLRSLSRILQASVYNFVERRLEGQMEGQSDSDEDEDVPVTMSEVSVEEEALRESVKILGDVRHMNKIAEFVDSLVDDHEAISATCHICNSLMIYGRMSASGSSHLLLRILAERSKFIRAIWFSVDQLSKSFGGSFTSAIVKCAESSVPLLTTFCTLLSQKVSTLHDEEFIAGHEVDSPMPFNVDQLIEVSHKLTTLCLELIDLAFPETKITLKNNYKPIIDPSGGRVSETTMELERNTKWRHIFKVCVTLLRQIYNRDLRLSFCPANHWEIPSFNLVMDKSANVFYLQQSVQEDLIPLSTPSGASGSDQMPTIDNGGIPMTAKQIRSIKILKEIPFTISFNIRVVMFQELLAVDKMRAQGESHRFFVEPRVHITVRRSHLYEDAFNSLAYENEPDFHGKFKVQMINAAGLEEVGIDGGGIFREFLSELLKTAFDPHRGFFMITTDNKLYPNPGAGKIVEDFKEHYYFIGRVLGKALYENLLVEVPLADFFLSKLVSKYSDVDINQLASLDPVLHRNLLSLKAYDGDVSELGLDFTVVCEELGETRVVELKPNGGNISVSNHNRMEYIHLMADYKLNRQIRPQCLAFREGLQNVIPTEWLSIFSNKELQLLISGAEHSICVQDLKCHTKYGGNYTADHPTIVLFWRVIDSFTDIQKRQFLKFVTSCSRPPLLGFRELDPPFCIQDAVNTERLPSASTCLNLLKLPPFQNEETLRMKLLYAIDSGSGFELS